MMGAYAEAEYAAGGKDFTLRIADFHGIGAIAAMGAAMGIEQSKEDADGYEKTATVDGEMQTESWAKTRQRGTFGRLRIGRATGRAGGCKCVKVEEGTGA